MMTAEPAFDPNCDVVKYEWGLSYKAWAALWPYIDYVKNTPFILYYKKIYCFPLFADDQLENWKNK